MKKVMKFFGALLFASLILSSCGGNSVDSDAKKLAKLQCKAQETMMKATSGDMSMMEENEKLIEEITILSEELEGKYTSEADLKRFTEVLLKEMEKCQ